MTTMTAIVRNGQLELSQPIDLPDGTEVEIRQVFEAEDLGAELAPKLKEQEARLHAQASKK